MSCSNTTLSWAGCINTLDQCLCLSPAQKLAATHGVESTRKIAICGGCMWCCCFGMVTAKVTSKEPLGTSLYKASPSVTPNTALLQAYFSLEFVFLQHTKYTWNVQSKIPFLMCQSLSTSDSMWLAIHVSSPSVFISESLYCAWESLPHLTIRRTEIHTV